MTILDGPATWLLVALGSGLSVLLIVGLIYALSFLLAGAQWLFGRFMG